MKRESIFLRLVIIAGIIILLVIPLMMIQSLINERQSYRNDAVNEISKSWASSQTVAGPVLTINKTNLIANSEGKRIFSKVNYNLLPENLIIESTVYPETRYRGIYQVTLYKTDIKIIGDFDFTGIDKSKYEEIFDNAEDKYVSFNISDLKGIEDNVNFKWNNLNENVSPGLRNSNLFKNGFSSDVELNNNEKKYNFEFHVRLKGSQQLMFLPLGKTTIVNMKSGWNNPSFVGEFLPSSRQLTDNGFKSRMESKSIQQKFPSILEE